MFLPIIFSLFLSLGAFAADSGKQDKEIMDVVEGFRISIIEKDENRFVNLFYDMSIPWIGVHTYRRAGVLPSKNGIDNGSLTGFIGYIFSTREHIEEKFWDIRIHTDGGIASVYFKYSFHKDGYKENWGDESWQLIKTGEGWRINSVIYSIILNPVPKNKK